MDNVNRLDDVAVMQSRPDTEFGRDLFVVFSLALIGVSGSELLDGKCFAVCRPLHQPDRATGTRSEHSAKLSVLAGQTVVIGKGDRLGRGSSRRSARAISRGGSGALFLFVANLEEAFQINL